MFLEEERVIPEEPTKEESSFVDSIGLGDEESGEKTEKTEKTEKKEEKEEEKKPKEEETEETEDTEETTEEEESTEETEEETEEESEEEPEDDKDLTQEEIDKLPKDAKGLYYAQRKQKKRAQTAEAERDWLRLQVKYGPKGQPVVKPETEAELKLEEGETVEDILKDKTDDDLLSVGEQRRIKAAEAREGRNKNKIAESKTNKGKSEQEMAIQKMDEHEVVFKKTHSDYDEMLNVFGQAVKDYPALQLEIIAEIKRADGDPARKVYEIGQKFKSIYTAKKKTVDGKPVKDVKRIVKNAKKKKPSGSVSGSSVTNEALEELEGEELTETLASMPMSQYMRVPLKIRNKAAR